MTVLAALCVCLSPCGLVRSEDMMPMRTEEHAGNSNPDQAAFHHVLPLNSVTFAGNVIKSRYVKNWIVLYCVPWFQQCAELQTVFSDLASKVQRARNDPLTMLSSEVRFAQVDCATNKPLCNAMKIDTYPVIMQYNGNRQSRWSGGYGMTRSRRQEKIPLADWVKMTLDDSSNLVDMTLGPIAAAWQMIDKDTKQLVGGLACVCVLVFSLTRCMDQFTQLAKLQVEAHQKSDPSATFLAVTPKASEASTTQLRTPPAQLIDLDALLLPAPSEAAQLSAAPASLIL